MRYLVTGSAGFIGYHLCRRLLDDGHEVWGYDGFTSYYDIALKEARNAQLTRRNGFHAARAMLEDADALARVWHESRPEVVVHLAAQAGVRYSLENPRSYVESNLVGTFNILELLRAFPVRHFLFASTSSVYGANTRMPFRETDHTVHPLTIYAASKAAGELMAHSYSHLWNIPTTAFRFFTVYGPWGRPDMALFKFTRAIIAGEPIDVYNGGDMRRDFTFVGDLVEAAVRLAAHPPERDAAVSNADTLSPAAPYRAVNIGGGSPVALGDFIAAIEAAVGRKAIRRDLPMQPGDVPATFAAADLLRDITGYVPDTPLAVGVRAFVDWYREHYDVPADRR